MDYICINLSEYQEELLIMNPNQPNGYQPYPGQFKNPQLDSYKFSNQGQFGQNTLNIPQSHNFNQGGSLSPTENHQLNRNKIDRAMYSSTIEPTNTASKNFTFGKLESIGRFVGNNEGYRNQAHRQNVDQGNGSHHQHDPNLQHVRDQRPKAYQTFSSSNANNHANQFDRFPAFNLQDKQPNLQPNNYPTNNYNNSHPTQQQKPQSYQSQQQTPQQKRRRQILAIKQQLQMINKKMQSSNLNKKYTNQQEKNDNSYGNNNNVTATIPTVSNSNSGYMSANNFSNNVSGNVMNNVSNNLMNNVSSNVMNNVLNNVSNNVSNNMPTTDNSPYSNSYVTTNNQQQNNLNSGLTFARNNQLNVGTYQRNKGLATQSMIVTNQPSPGYKYQNIFDKYDSLKKPTYQTQSTQVLKQDKPMLLDKFVNKGVGQQQINKEKQHQSSSHSNSYSNPVNSTNGNDTSNYDFSKPTQKSNEATSNISSDYSSSSSTSYSTTGSISNTYEAPKQGGGMFKKKKDTSHVQQVKTVQFVIPTQQKSNNSQAATMFKKFKPQNSQDDIFTNVMKKMNIEESVQFKRDDFAVGKKLGKGQFGQVMLVQHKKTGFLCGMKVMQKKQIRDQKYEGQIARELSIQFYLAHRNIAPLYGYFQDQKNVYLLVEYCTGGQLLELLRKNRRMEQPQVSRIIRQIIEGIDYIHKQLIIHRDVKPENILFNFGVAKICDYGWAVYKGHGMRKTASVGSPLYYSPQIVLGVEYDQKIDIWDVGMMTYECLLGKIPFRIYSELDLNRIVEDQIKFPQYIDTTDQAKDFILRIMKKKPEQRMEIRQMLRHPFITKYQDLKLPVQIMKDFKEILSG